MIRILLSYFDKYSGPQPLLSVPEKIPEEITNKVKKFLDVDIGEPFFDIGLIEEGLKVVNLYFELDSPWARGGKEMVLLSVISDKNYKNNIFYDTLNDFSKKLISDQKIYKALYIDEEDHREREEIEKEYKRLENLLRKILDTIEDRIHSSIMGKLLILGISKVGKSTIINYIKKQAFSPDIKPTLTLSLIETMIESYLFKLIDVSGQRRLRDQWWRYTKHPDAIIFVLDIQDSRERLKESKREFEKIVERFSDDDNNDQTLSNDTPILILANKSDLISGNKEKHIDDIKDLLNLNQINLKHKIFITSALTGKGIEQAFHWLVLNLLNVSK